MTLFDKKPEKKVESIIIDGSFTCMTCDEVAEEANYLPVEQMLGWTCSNGHKSVIEKFSLGV